jgi:EAL domain-containing protein (putative c-di-GMP-specific phosphodiesterase class I)
VIDSWQLQLPMLLLGIAFYFGLIFFIFINDRVRFTNHFSDNRYSKLELRKAIQNKEFVSFYQPIINIQDGSILGFEALTRWQRGDELLQPNKFFDEINNYGLKKEIDENTYRNIKLARKRLEELNIRAYSFFSINITHQTFESMIKETPDTIINFSESEKEYFLVELLEEIIIHDEIADKIHFMNDDSVLFAVDDFGTGNSNVAFIRNFENLKVKIDKVFVPKDLEDEEEKVIIESFVKMFGDKGLKLIVEGVETREQYLYLKDLKVAGAQGYYFSQPLPLDELIEFMEKKDFLKKM